MNPDNVGFPADATAAYESLHGQSKKPDLYLKSLKSAGKARQLTAREKELIAKHRPFDAQLQTSFEKVTQDLKDQGLFDYSLLHVLWRTFELFFFMTLGSWAATRGSTIGWWFGALCGIFFLSNF